MIEIQPFESTRPKAKANLSLFFNDFVNWNKKTLARKQARKNLIKLLISRMQKLINQSGCEQAIDKLKKVLSYYKRQLSKKDHTKSCNYILELLQILKIYNIKYDNQTLFSPKNIQSINGIRKKQIKFITQQLKFYCQVAEEFKTDPQNAILRLNFRYDKPTATHVNPFTKNAIQGIFESLNKNFDMKIDWEEIRFQLGGVETQQKKNRRQKDRIRKKGSELRSQSISSRNRSRSKGRIVTQK